MRLNLRVLSCLLVWCLADIAAAANVIEDQSVGMSRQELESLVKYWTPDMQKAAANNLGDRVELLNMALTNKKIAHEADSISPDADPDAYWRLVFTIRNLKRQFVVKRFMDSLEVPDMSELAKERYESEKKKYAFVLEERSTSHILLLCPPGQCVRAERRPDAEKILAELKAGANFEELVTAYSEDPGSKDKGGKFDKWMKLGEANVAPHYTGGAFSIEQVGGYSDIVETQFGFHIIRLDGIREEYFKPYSEVKEQIIAALEQEYRNLSAKEFDAGFRISDEAFIDGPAMEAIFAPYKTGESPE